MRAAGYSPRQEETERGKVVAWRAVSHATAWEFIHKKNGDLTYPKGALPQPERRPAREKDRARRKDAKTFGAPVCPDLCAFASLRDLFFSEPEER
jgi:ferric-dicitrate binding protein FerR (iron transport regulator)